MGGRMLPKLAKQKPYRDNPAALGDDGMPESYSDEPGTARSPMEMLTGEDEEEFGLAPQLGHRYKPLGLQQKLNILICLIIALFAFGVIDMIDRHSSRSGATSSSHDIINNNHAAANQLPEIHPEDKAEDKAESPAAGPAPPLSTRDLQIESFKEGDGIALNIHITHHAGTQVCAALGRAPGMHSPSFACMGAKKEDNAPDFPGHGPWSHYDTEKNIEITKKYFNFISWEFRTHPPKQQSQIRDTNLEHPNLVTIYVSRDPLSRMLAGDGMLAKKYPNLEAEGTKEMWWNFANEPLHTNNYALGVLAGPDCCNGTNTDPIYLDNAKELLQRFTFVLDIACLDDGMNKVAELLNIDYHSNRQMRQRILSLHRTHPPPEERIPYPEVYKFLRDRNHLDIQMHEFAKSISLVDCSKLSYEP